jgi:hypothetical protein
MAKVKVTIEVDEELVKAYFDYDTLGNDDVHQCVKELLHDAIDAQMDDSFQNMITVVE